ncbi:PREDICTED: uncharacterized protein LOC104815048 [Tarenaya hassleriana]|uniref:uncharacterized protein LOC104815048 n=1 Tax=Tarenaya hassleriana TaxID=28532 RepID=UPI00053C7013|nr:PREDICTED: uncharacterized protein LOC104815048 [Tarenaya hassleriana]
MLRKRNRSHQKHLMVSDSDSCPGQSESSRLKNQRNGSIFSIPSLFVAFSNKGSSENDSVWSPTSPLDFRLFSGLRNPFAGSSKSVHQVHQKSWDSTKVGLSIVDSLDDASGNVLQSSESKNVLFGIGMKFGNLIYNAPKVCELDHTLKDYPVFPQSLSKPPAKDNELGTGFENGDNSTIKQDPFCSLSSYGAMGSSSQRTSSSSGDTGVGKAHILAHPPALNGFPLKPSLECLSGNMDPDSESEIELSEDYTRVISHGPNPKTTHFYGDRILESLDNHGLNKGFSSFKEQKDLTTVSMPLTQPADGFPPENFLSFCNFCNKHLQGEDIYMYRGYIAFCSDECRSKGIIADEKTDEAALSAKSVVSDKARKKPV